MLTCLDLFSGIGGFALGFDRAGIRTTAFCEFAEYPRRVLKKHWPETPIYNDVRTLNADQLRADGIAMPDIICGGFPCQDISLAGKGAGLGGERSGLWWEYHRLIAECRPSWVVAENVAALRGRGLDEVLGSLSALGYDAEWHCIPASALGAPHRRDRVWIIAHPNGTGSHAGALPGIHHGEAGAGAWDGEPERLRSARPSGVVAHAPRDDQPNQQEVNDAGRALERPRTGTGGGIERGNTASGSHLFKPNQIAGGAGDVAHPNGCVQPNVSFNAVPRLRLQELVGRWGDAWDAEPNVGRVANGVPSRVDRLRCLGNAVVPQIPELIGRAIVAAHNIHQ